MIEIEKITLDGEEVKLKEYVKTEELSQVQEQIADQQKQMDALQSPEAPTFVDSVDEMTDTTKSYVNTETGTIWVYRTATYDKEVTVREDIVGTDDNPYHADSRLSSSITEDSFTSASGYLVTPLIDLTKAEYKEKTIKLHLEGLKYYTDSDEIYVQTRLYGLDGTIVVGRDYTSEVNNRVWTHIYNAEISDISDKTVVFTFCPPLEYSSTKTECWYLRFGAKGIEADSNIYITYEETQVVTEATWVDTGVSYGGSGVDSETLDKISALNNEGTDPTTIKLLAQPVLEFYNSADYSSDDYTTSHLEKITYPCRADIPIPFNVKWNHNENAMRTTLVVDTKAIGTVNAYRMRIYDVTGLDNYPIYNLLPNTTYYYKVTHVLSDGSLVEAKSGNFTTSDESIRLICIDGTQNVRDLGGWTALDGKTVKYGKIFRGATFSDSTQNNLMLTGKGRLSLAELRVQAELNLGASDTETSIASNCTYKKIEYNSYALAITSSYSRTLFKEALEHIVTSLQDEKNVYIHCQGGCDRTGTLVFQLLGLLGVSESDIAKEYELSSFSDIGFGRLRTNTLEANTYDYVGMVEALKTYSGDTIADKFYNFAIDCGVPADTITSFRNLMLE